MVALVWRARRAPPSARRTLPQHREAVSRLGFLCLAAGPRPHLAAACRQRRVPYSQAMTGAQARPPGTEFLDAETGRQNRPLKCANVGRDQSPGIEWPKIPAETPYLASWRKTCGLRGLQAIVHTSGTPICNSDRGVSIRSQHRQVIVAIASSLTAPFYHLKRRLCSGFSEVYIFRGWIGNSRVTCSGCSLDRLVVSMFCRPLCRQVTF